MFVKWKPYRIVGWNLQSVDQLAALINHTRIGNDGCKYKCKYKQRKHCLMDDRILGWNNARNRQASDRKRLAASRVEIYYVDR